MKIKIVVNSFPKVSETFLFNLVKELEINGHMVMVSSLSRQNDAEFYKGRMNEWSGRIEYLPSYKNIFVFIYYCLYIIVFNSGYFYYYFKRNGLKSGFRDTIKTLFLLKGAPDIIHFSYSGIGVGFLDIFDILRSKSIKTFVSCRGSAEKVKPIVDLYRAEKLRQLFQKCDRVHCVSEEMLHGLYEYGLEPEKAFINYPSIDFNTFKRELPLDYSEKETWEFTTTGRLHFQKGYLYSLQALKELKEKKYKFKYNILGEGPDLPLLKYLVHEWNLNEEVIFHGKVDSGFVKQILKGTDIFILPSLYEGVANAALEAMAMEIPLVTTRAGGMSEVVTNKENGIIVNRFNSSELAIGIEELLLSEHLRRKVGVNGRESIIKMFDLQTQIDKFVGEYLSAIRSI
jgi:colanic acid/amylovoran biosynthesis glycosyltransferase